MALKTNSSFSDGFTQGFGLVNSVKDRQLKKDSLEQQAVNDAADRQYKSDTLDLKKQDGRDLKLFREESVKTDRLNNKDRNVTAGITANTARLTAETQAAKAATERLKQEQLTDENSLESQNLQADINSKTAATAIKTDNLRASQDAVTLSEIYNLTQGRSQYSDSDIQGFNNKMEQLKGGRFDPSLMVTQVGLDSPKVISGFLQQLSEGIEVDMSPEVLRAVGSGLNLGSSRSVGQVVDSSFKNAPTHMQQGNYVVSEQGLLSGNATRVENPDNTFSDGISGTLFVELASRDDPDDITYYFPPTTPHRSSTTQTPLVLTMDEVAQTTAANSHMINKVGPQIRSLAQQAKKQQLFGDNKGNNGVEGFENAVAKIIETNRKAIQNGGNVTSLMGMTEEHAALSREQMLDAGRMAKMKRLVEDEILFGVPAEPKVSKVKKWLAKTESALSQQSVPQSKGSDTLGSIVGDNWNPQLISNLNGFFDVKDGQTFITDEDALIAELKQLGYWN